MLERGGHFWGLIKKNKEENQTKSQARVTPPQIPNPIQKAPHQLISSTSYQET
jgi:hypothetical protein